MLSVRKSSLYGTRKKFSYGVLHFEENEDTGINVNLNLCLSVLVNYFSFCCILSRTFLDILNSSYKGGEKLTIARSQTICQTISQFVHMHSTLFYSIDS